MNLKISDGFDQIQRSKAISLFWVAFRGKLNLIMSPEEKALAFLNLVADPSHAISATNDDGILIGIAGFKTKQGSFIGGGLPELRSIYGVFGGTWRGLVLSLLERPLQADTLLMDGIFVSEEARGKGVGSGLLRAIKAKAETLNCSKVRLDVIDSNPRARALYERQGFVADGVSKLGPLRYLFGFREATTMVWSASEA